jgi:hypothetical protein
MELPNLAQRAELVRRYAHLLAFFGRELGQRPLVLHDGAFFPDVFENDQPSLERLVRRLQVHAGMSDIPIQVQLLDADGNTTSGCGSGAGVSGAGCGSGACGPKPSAAKDGESMTRLVETEHSWLLNVQEGELRHAVALTTTLARALAQIFLVETSDSSAPVEPPLEASVDLTTVALGLGLLSLEGSYIYGKGCGGPSVTRVTALSVGEMATACALFIAVGGHSGSRALAKLSTTQKALLGEANEWVASNADVVRRLKSAPGLLATRAPDLKETRSWLARLFDRSAREPSLEEALAGNLGETELLELARSAGPRRQGATGEASAPRRASRSAEDDELKALVDEALRSRESPV